MHAIALALFFLHKTMKIADNIRMKNSKRRYLFFIFLWVAYSCSSEINVTLLDKDNILLVSESPSISLETLSLTSSNLAQSVSLTIPYSGDSNDNAAVTLYFCSLRKQVGCDPLLGEFVTLYKSGNELIGTLSIALSSQLTPGDMMKFQLISSDIDGVVGGNDDGVILIPFDFSIPREIRPLGKYTLGTGVSSNAGGAEKIYTSALASDGSLFLAGSTSGSLGEPNSNSSEDVLIIKLLADGSLNTGFANNGILQLGGLRQNTEGVDVVNSIALDGDGNLFAVGKTSSLGRENAGGTDGFVLKINSNTGVLDTEFGDGDGSDNDGIVQFNATNAVDASLEEILVSVVYSAGKLYVAGHTKSSLGGVNAGGSDIVIAKLDALSGELDTGFGTGDGIVQINASNSNAADRNEYATNLVLDQAGNIFVTGYTYLGDLGGTNAGGADGIIIKLNANSGVLDNVFGDGDGIGNDNDGIVQLNSSNVSDASDDDWLKDLVLDSSGNCYAAGQSGGDIGGVNGGFGEDVFVVKLNCNSGVVDTSFGDGDGGLSDGVVQLNAVNTVAADRGDSIGAISIDGAGNIFIVGYAQSGLGGSTSSAFVTDGFIAKLSGATGLLDSQFGDGDGNDNDGIVQVNSTYATDANSNDTIAFLAIKGDNIFITGHTGSSYGGTRAGGSDAFAMKLDSINGALDNSFGNGDGKDFDGITLVAPLGSGDAGGQESINCMDTDGDGNLYAAGETSSSFGGVNSGGTDGFIVKFDTYGALDKSFGSGDGVDNDGILQINALNGIAANGDEHISAMVIDSNGDIFVSGSTGSSVGGILAGGTDALIIKINGSTGSLDTSFGNGDGNNGDGILQFNGNNTNAADDDEVLIGIAVDNVGNLYVGGSTGSDLGGTLEGVNTIDPFVAKLSSISGILDNSYGDGDGIDNDGIVQLNTLPSSNSSNFKINAMALDSITMDIFLAGSLRGSYGGANSNSPQWDVFVAKFNALADGALDTSFGDGDGVANDGVVQLNAGNLSDTDSSELARSLTLDGVGNIFLAGSTYSALGGAHAGAGDIFVVKMDTTDGVLDASFGDGDGTDNDGVVQVNIASASSQDTPSVLVFNGGILHIAGYTEGPLGGASTSRDGYVLKMDATSGLLSTVFGDGDGADNDGILQVNTLNAGTDSVNYINAFTIDIHGNMYFGGSIHGTLSDDKTAGEYDAYTVVVPVGRDGL